jgi:hypothetical protein
MEFLLYAAGGTARNVSANISGGNGIMFDISGASTITLGNNVDMIGKGTTANAGPLVRIRNSSASFVMEGNSTISGNQNNLGNQDIQISGNSGGAAVYVQTGTLLMKDTSKIYNNVATNGFYNANAAGVFVFANNAARLVMEGGEISGNTTYGGSAADVILWRTNETPGQVGQLIIKGAPVIGKVLLVSRTDTTTRRITPIYVNGALTEGANIGVGFWEYAGGTPALTTNWWRENDQLVLRAAGYTGLFTEADMDKFSLKTLHGQGTGNGTTIPSSWKIFTWTTGTNMRLTKSFS